MATQQKPIDNLEDKLALSIELCEITLRCERCSKLFKKAIEDHVHQGGGLTTANSQTKEIGDIDNT
jgi:hypothetical protein